MPPSGTKPEADAVIGQRKAVRRRGRRDSRAQSRRGRQQAARIERRTLVRRRGAQGPARAHAAARKKGASEAPLVRACRSLAALERADVDFDVVERQLDQHADAAGDDVVEARRRALRRLAPARPSGCPRRSARPCRHWRRALARRLPRRWHAALMQMRQRLALRALQHDVGVRRGRRARPRGRRRRPRSSGRDNRSDSRRGRRRRLPAW